MVELWNKMRLNSKIENRTHLCTMNHGTRLQCINIFRRSVMKKRFYIPAYGGCSHQDDIMWDIQVQIC